MKPKTITALNELLTEIQSLATCLLLTIGEANAKALAEAAENLKQALAEEDLPAKPKKYPAM